MTPGFAPCPRDSAHSHPPASNPEKVSGGRNTFPCSHCPIPASTQHPAPFPTWQRVTMVPSLPAEGNPSAPGPVLQPKLGQPAPITLWTILQCIFWLFQHVAFSYPSSVSAGDVSTLVSKAAWSCWAQITSVLGTTCFDLTPTPDL